MFIGSMFMYSLVALVVIAGVVCVLVYSSRQRAKKLAPWKLIRNSMTADQVRSVLGQPRLVTPLDTGENWDYGRRPHEATVTFTDGKVTGYIKPF